MAGDKALREQEFRLEHQNNTSWGSAATVDVVQATVAMIWAKRVAQSGGRLRRATFSCKSIAGASKGATALLYVRGSTALATSVAFTTSNQTVNATIRGGEVAYSKGDEFTLRIKTTKATHSVTGAAVDYVCWEGR